MSAWTKPAVGHMPFPGHRTCAEWDTPVRLKKGETRKPVKPEQEPEILQSDTPMTEADILSRHANVPLELAQLVVMIVNQSPFTLRDIRSYKETHKLREWRQSIIRQVRRAGFSYNEIGRAMNRDHSAIVKTMNGLKS